MNNFQWVIPQDSMVTAKSIDGLSDVVVTVNAYRQVSDETTSTQIPVCVGLTPPTEGFIPYADLTNDLVISWIQTGSGADSIANIEYCIADQIAMQINPPVTPENTPLPWS